MRETDIFSKALERLENAASIVDPDPDVLEVLRHPKQTMKARLTIRMDDGRRRSFIAWRCRYDDTRGPTKGGVRFHPGAGVEEVESLAFWMTFKCAVANLPYGGGKGAVQVDPSTLSTAELERLARAYVRAFRHVIGPDRDIPAPDVSTNAMTMGWMADEYAALVGAWTPAAVTGKPVALGGSLGRREATGLGGYIVFKHLAERLDLAGPRRIAVQGLGNVGLTIARLFAVDGHRIVAVSDAGGGLVGPDGLDIEAISRAKAERRPLAELAGGAIQRGPPDAPLSADCDLLVPAALENAVSRDNAAAVKARVILEMANGPVTPEADATLANRGVRLIPDVLANAGGVTVSYFEWLQNRQGRSWTLEEVNAELSHRMEAATDAVWNLAEKEGVVLRTAAYVHGLRRLCEAIAAQGLGRDFAPAEKSSLPGD